MTLPLNKPHASQDHDIENTYNLSGSDTREYNFSKLEEAWFEGFAGYFAGELEESLRTQPFHEVL